MPDNRASTASPNDPARLASSLLLVMLNANIAVDDATTVIRRLETGKMKVLRFSEAGLDCNFEVHGKTVEEVLKKAVDHARKGHELDVTEDSLDAWRGLIREE